MLGSDMLSKISRHPGSIWLQFSCILSIEWCSISTSFYSTIWDIDALFVCHYNSTHPLCKSAAFTHAGMVQHFLLHKPKKHIEPFQQVRLGFEEVVHLRSIVALKNRLAICTLEKYANLSIFVISWQWLSCILLFRLPFMHSNVECFPSACRFVHTTCYRHNSDVFLRKKQL